MRRLLSATLGFVLLLPSLPAYAAPSTAAEAEAYVQATGILPALADGEFHGADHVTRMDVVRVVLSQVYRLDDPETCYSKIAAVLPPRFSLLFADVPADTAHAKQLCIAMVAGLVSGKRDGTFGPWERITTAEASKILTRAYGLYEIGCTEPAGAPWYQTYMWKLRGHGALPVSADRFNHFVTRTELAQMLYGLRDLEVQLWDADVAGAKRIVVRANSTPEVRPVGSQRAEEAIVQAGREPTIRGVPVSVFLRTAQTGAADATR